jgi:hypothetical protein
LYGSASICISALLPAGRAIAEVECAEAMCIISGNRGICPYLIENIDAGTGAVNCKKCNCAV